LNWVGISTAPVILFVVPVRACRAGLGRDRLGRDHHAVMSGALPLSLVGESCLTASTPSR
jgi:hypothetical protein